MEGDDSHSSSSEELFPIQNRELPSVFKYTHPDSYSGIIKAVLLRDLDKLKELVGKAHSLRCTDNLGNTVLHVAALCCTDKNTKILEYILSLWEIDKDATNFRGQTALLACTKEKLVIPAEMLIDAGCDVTKATPGQITPLHYSVRYSEKVSHKLILAGANVNHVDYYGNTPLHDAISFGELEVVCMLLYYGADNSIRNLERLTPFMLSLATDKISIALELFDYVTDFNLETEAKGLTLHMAVTSRFPRIKEMCELGADMNRRGIFGHNVFNLEVFPRLEDFRYFWSGFDCDDYENTLSNILVRVCRYSDLAAAEQLEILRTLFEHEDLKKTTWLMDNSSNELATFFIVHTLYVMGVSEDIVHTFIACMLVCNAIVTELDLGIVYEHYGYCETFKLLLHMDIKTNTYVRGKINVFPTLIHKMDWCQGFESEVWKFLKCSINFETYFEDVDYENIFDHLINTNFKRELLYLCPNSTSRDSEPKLPWTIRLETMRECLSATPDVPLLQELARNKSRDFICEKYSARTSCKFYTILKSLPLPKMIKQMIAFEIPLYEHSLTPRSLNCRSQLKECRKFRINHLIHEFIYGRRLI